MIITALTSKRSNVRSAIFIFLSSYHTAMNTTKNNSTFSMSLVLSEPNVSYLHDLLSLTKDLPIYSVPKTCEEGRVMSALMYVCYITGQF
jgi:hypothetical protein